MRLFNDLKMYGRFARGLSSYLRHPISTDEAQAHILHRLAERERNFLRLLERGVFGHPRSPYLPLLKLAQCGFSDIKTMVMRDGLEATLRALRAAGVYVTFEECKGRQPIVRDGRVFEVRDRDFDNPFIKASYESESGGSTGAGTRVQHDLDHLAEQAPHRMLTYAAHGILDAPIVVWRGVLPDGSGIDGLLCLARFGRTPVRWLSPIATEDLKSRMLRFRLATSLTVSIARWVGVNMPRPEYVPVDRPEVVARTVADVLRTHGACAVNAVASRALSVCVAAAGEGLDLTGATFMVAGEPVTPGKVKGILETGARYFPTYGFSEAGRIGMGCAHPTGTNDLHLMAGLCAVIQHPRPMPYSDETVSAFNVTSLLPSAPKILLNAESDDYGVLETRECGCPLGALGLTQHLRDIRSFGKLTGEGVTLVGSDMTRVLEEVLPQRFGGTALDYQLMEAEDDDGVTRLTLLVNPEVHIERVDAVVTTLLEAIAEQGVGADVARATWAQAGTIRVTRAVPVRTARGKLFPLYVPARATSPTLRPTRP
jgi:hypothetical protein